MVPFPPDGVVAAPAQAVIHEIGPPLAGGGYVRELVFPSVSEAAGAVVCEVTVVVEEQRVGGGEVGGEVVGGELAVEV